MDDRPGTLYSRGFVRLTRRSRHKAPGRQDRAVIEGDEGVRPAVPGVPGVERLARQTSVGPDVRADHEGAQHRVVGRFPAVTLHDAQVPALGVDDLRKLSEIDGRLVEVGRGDQVLCRRQT